MSRGFTIIEIVLSLALMTLIFGIGSPFVINEMNRHSLKQDRYAVEQALLSAQSRSAHNFLDDEWSVIIQATSTVLFKGSTFSSRQTDLDTVWGFSGNTMVSGTNLYHFAKNSFKPTATGTTTFSNYTSEPLSISVSSGGAITLE